MAVTRSVVSWTVICVYGGGTANRSFINDSYYTPEEKLAKDAPLRGKETLHLCLRGITSDWGGRGVYPSNTSLAMGKTIVLREL